MPLVASVDYTAKRIYLTVQALVGDFDTSAVYREVRSLRRVIEAHRMFPPMIIGGGNIQKTSSTYTQAYVQLLRGCRLVPAEATGRIKLIRDTFTDDGLSGAECFDRSSVVANVDIDVAVQAVEIRTVSLGGGTDTLTAADVKAALADDFATIDKNTRLIPALL